MDSAGPVYPWNEGSAQYVSAGGEASSTLRVSSPAVTEAEAGYTVPSNTNSRSIVRVPERLNS